MRVDRKAYDLLLQAEAGLLSTAFSNTKAKSRRVSCMSNLRQIGQAQMMYMNQNKSYRAPFADTVANQGAGPAGASTTRFYLSANTFLDGSDVVLAGTPIDLRRVLTLDKPVVRVRYDLEPVSGPPLAELLAPLLHVTASEVPALV